MRRQKHVFTAIAVPLALAAFTLPGMGVDTVYAQEKGTGAAPSKVEITIRDRVHGYETVGHTYPSQDTMIVVHNKDTVTHGLASMLFKEIRVSIENGTEIRGKYFKSFHVEPGQTMTLRFATAPSKFEPVGAFGEFVLCTLVRHPPGSERRGIRHRGQRGTLRRLIA